MQIKILSNKIYTIYLYTYILYTYILYKLYYPYRQYTNVIYLPVARTPQLQSTSSRVKIAINNFPKVIKDCMFCFLSVVRQVCNRSLCVYKCHFVIFSANFSTRMQEWHAVIYVYIYSYLYVEGLPWVVFPFLLE